ncbi:MAG: M10 family metallopeptidase C-terminal domain-containing protein [Pseudomonadota bacterium]
MCMLCTANPINAIDGTHDKLADYLAKASSLVGVDETLVHDGAIGEIEVGGTISASFGDGEVYRLDLTEGETVAIDLSGFGIDTVVSLYDADGNLVGMNDDVARGFDTDSRLLYTAEDAGSFYIKVDSFVGDALASDAFQLTVEMAEASGQATLDTLADQLETGYWSTPRKWNLSDSGYLAKDGSLTFNITGNEEDGNGLTAARQELVREGFKVFEAMLGIDFVEVSGTGADFRFSDDNAGAYAGSAYGTIGGQGYISYAVVNVDRGWYGSSSAYDGYTFQTILHEIGHALGLGHQGDYNGSASYGRDAKYANDSWQGSMMSYFSQTANTAVDASYAFLLSPMAADWIALDDLYGEYGFSTANAFAGDTVWGFNTTISAEVSAPWSNLADHADNMAFTIVDGGGIDTVDFSGYAYDQRIDLTVTEGSFTQATTSDVGNETGNMTLAVGTVIENAVTGAGDDVLIGNAADNTLDGGAGNDSLTGGAGDDRLIGGGGADTAVFLGDFAQYTFASFSGYWEVTGEGTDRIDDSVERLSFADRTIAYGDLEETGDGVQEDPDARADVFSVSEDGSVSADLFADNGAGSDSHPSGLGFAVTSVDGAAPGSVTLASGASYSVGTDGSFSFATNGAYNALAVGESATVAFDYTITSSDGGTDTATATITVVGGNDGPIAMDDAFTVSEGETLDGNLIQDNGAGRDSDVDTSDTLNVVAINGQASTTVVLASGATVAFGTDGTFVYAQGSAFDELIEGESALETFTYTLADGNGGTSEGTVRITITGTTPEGVVSGTGGNDDLLGTAQADTIDGGGGRDLISAGDGDDVVTGGLGRDRLLGGDGNDQIDGGDEADRIYGGRGDDIIEGGEGRDNVRGDEGRDLLYGGGDRDLLDGGDGGDVLHGGEDADALRGGDGDDVLYGGNDGDNLRGDDGNDALYGGDGADALTGGDGDDQLHGDAGDDRLTGGNGNDSLFGGDGDDRVNGGNGDDLMAGGSGADSFSGGRGFDTVSYAEADAGVVVSLDRRGEVGGAAEGDSFSQVEAIIGSAFDDVIGGDRLDNTFTGGTGADRFVFDQTRTGEDTITDFGNGADRLDFTALGLSFADFTIEQLGADAVLTTSQIADLKVVLSDLSAGDLDALDFV